MFTADKVVFEFTADTAKLDKAYGVASRDAKKHGKKAADNYEDGFDGETVGRGLIASLASGINKGGPALKTALKATTALSAAGVTLGLGFAATARAAIGYAADMQVMADVAGVSAERFQELRFAASQFGVEGDKVSDILKDVNDKFGDFAITGQGPLADFFENVAPKVGVTADDFRDLASDEALGLFVSSLEKAGANSQDLSFFMESLAGDATMLLPLFANNGEKLAEFSANARDAGRVLSNDAARGAQEADQKFNELGATLRGGLTVAVVDNADAITELTQDVIDLIPTVLGWADNIVAGFDNLGKSIARAEDIFQASRFGSGKRDSDPETMPEVQERLSAIIALNQINDKFIEEEKSFIGRLRKSKNDAQRYELGVKIFGKDGLEELRAGGRDFRDAIRIEFNRTTDMLKDMQEGPADAGAAFATPPGAAGGGIAGGGAGGGIAGGGAKRIAEKDKAEARRLADQARATQQRIAEAQKLREANLTAEEQYQADLADIRAVEADPMLLEVAGGEETIMRARIEALVDLAAASDDVGAAHTALAAAIEDGTLTTGAALEATTRLNAEFGIFTKAELEARAVVEEKNDALQKQIEYQLELAEISGNYDEATRLTRELEVLRRKGDLLRDNIELTEQEAQARAQAEADRLSKAQDLAGFDAIANDTGTPGESQLGAELARIDEREQAKIELLESYRTAETEKLRDFEALKTQIEAEADAERMAIKAQALDDQLALAEGVFGGISDLLKAAGKEDSKTAKRIAKAEKGIAITRATVNTALGVSQALANAPPPLNFINAALVGAAGAVQIATIASTFKDGVVDLKGPGSARSDDIPAMLSRGESVLTARATRGNELGLERLNAGMSPREAFGLGRGFMDGVIAVDTPMSKAPDISAPDSSAFSDMAANATQQKGGDTHYYDLHGVDTAQMIDFINTKQRETEAKVPTLVATDDAKQKRARPRS